MSNRHVGLDIILGKQREEHCITDVKWRPKERKRPEEDEQRRKTCSWVAVTRALAAN